MLASTPYPFFAKTQTCSQHYHSSEISATVQNMIIYVSTCLCVGEVAVGGLRGMHVSVRKSRPTICCLPPQSARHWNWSSTISCSQQCGQRESKVTAKDSPQSATGCDGGLMCHATAVTLHTLSHKHIFTAAKHHLNCLNARLSLPVWMNPAPDALIWVLISPVLTHCFESKTPALAFLICFYFLSGLSVLWFSSSEEGEVCLVIDNMAGGGCCSVCSSCWTEPWAGEGMISCLCYLEGASQLPMQR